MTRPTADSCKALTFRRRCSVNISPADGRAIVPQRAGVANATAYSNELLAFRGSCLALAVLSPADRGAVCTKSAAVRTTRAQVSEGLTLERTLINELPAPTNQATVHLEGARVRATIAGADRRETVFLWRRPRRQWFAPARRPAIPRAVLTQPARTMPNTNGSKLSGTPEVPARSPRPPTVKRTVCAEPAGLIVAAADGGESLLFRRRCAYAPADRGTVRAQRASMQAPTADRHEALPFRRPRLPEVISMEAGVCVHVEPPTNRRTIFAQRARVLSGATDCNEVLVFRRIRFTVVVLTPAHCGAVFAQRACVLITAADYDEGLTERRRTQLAMINPNRGADHQQATHKHVVCHC